MTNALQPYEHVLLPPVFFDATEITQGYASREHVDAGDRIAYYSQLQT